MKSPSYLPIQLSILLLFLIAPIAGVAGSLSKTADQLARQLDDQAMLSGLHIQVVEDHFLDQATGRHLGFSNPLSEALSAALSNRGATVSLQEQGDIPLKLVGSYLQAGDQVTITVRLRRMGMNSSSDLAVASRTTELSDLDLRWFQTDLEQVARGLIRQVEAGYAGGDDIRLTVELSRPALQGKPSLQLGRELQRLLEQAATGTELFGSSSFGVTRNTYILKSTYGLLDKSVEIRLWLIDQDGKTVSSGSTVINQDAVPSALLAMVDDQDRSLCLQYIPQSRADEKTGSLAANLLLDTLAGALAEYGMQSTVCNIKEPGTTRIQASLRIDNRSTRDGYSILIGTTSLKVVGPDGRTIGNLTQKERQPSSDRDMTARNKVIEKLFSQPFKEKLATVVLAERSNMTGK